MQFTAHLQASGQQSAGYIESLVLIEILIGTLMLWARRVKYLVYANSGRLRCRLRCKDQGTLLRDK